MPKHHVLILGSGAAGVAAARALASREDIRVTLAVRTGETPYTRMLIKGVAFGPTPPEMIKLPLPDVEVLSDTAVEVDTSAKEVQLASGTRLSYDALIVATGSRPRMLPADVGGEDAVTDAGRVGSLHSLEDALRVRRLLTGLGRPARVAIYGGGVIAAETASSLHSDGHIVTLISRSEVPGVTAFGAPVAERLAADHSARVLARLGRTVRHIEVTDTGVAITLDNDSPVVADFLVLALGTTPAARHPGLAASTSTIASVPMRRMSMRPVASRSTTMMRSAPGASTIGRTLRRRAPTLLRSPCTSSASRAIRMSICRAAPTWRWFMGR